MRESVAYSESASMARHNLRRAEYDKSIAWIACHGTPESLLALIAYTADQFGQRHADVESDVRAAFKVSDVTRGSPVSVAIFGRSYVSGGR
jgi:hypothetical protein